MRLNISQLLEYQSCPQRWYNQYVAKRTTPPTAALSDGIYWHQLAEAWLRYDPLLPRAEGPVQDRMREFVESGRLPRYAVVGTELALEMPLGRHTLIGALDGISPTEQSAFYSLQWKTCAGGQDLQRQCDAVRYSYHEVAYEALMNHHNYPCAGTLLGVYKKLTKGELAAGVQPYSAHILTRPAGYVNRIMSELEMWADKMDMIEQGNGLIIPHRRTCIQGFIRCKYWESCYQGKPLSDLSYIDAEDRYAPPAEEAA